MPKKMLPKSLAPNSAIHPSLRASPVPIAHQWVATVKVAGAVDVFLSRMDLPGKGLQSSNIQAKDTGGRRQNGPVSLYLFLERCPRVQAVRASIAMAFWANWGQNSQGVFLWD